MCLYLNTLEILFIYQETMLKCVSITGELSERYQPFFRDWVRFYWYLFFTIFTFLVIILKLSKMVANPSVIQNHHYNWENPAFFGVGQAARSMFFKNFIFLISYIYFRDQV